MFLSYKPRTLLVALLGTLALSPCFAVPVGAGSNPPQSPSSGGGPATPAGKAIPIRLPPAPMKNGQKAPPEFIMFITKWMEKKEDRFRAMASSKGGTEGWAQFDFEVETKLRQGIDIESSIDVREQRIYADQTLAADWVFAPGNNHKGLIVELKVESSSQKGAALASKALKDQRKILSPLTEKYKDYQRAVVAIAWTPITQRALVDANMFPLADWKITMKSHPGQEIKLYEWNGELKGTDSPSGSNPLAANVPLAHPGKQSLTFGNAPSQRPQTPSSQSPGGQVTSQTLDSPETPSKKVHKVRDLLRKLKLHRRSNKNPPEDHAMRTKVF